MTDLTMAHTRELPREAPEIVRDICTVALAMWDER